MQADKQQPATAPMLRMLFPAPCCSAQVTQPNNTGLAIFQRTAHADSHHCLDTCLQAGVLRTATITIYINRVFTWCARRILDQQKVRVRFSSSQGA